VLCTSAPASRICRDPTYKLLLCRPLLRGKRNWACMPWSLLFAWAPHAFHSAGHAGAAHSLHDCRTLLQETDVVCDSCSSAPNRVHAQLRLAALGVPLPTRESGLLTRTARSASGLQHRSEPSQCVFLSSLMISLNCPRVYCSQSTTRVVDPEHSTSRHV
jgi:hypothetical protein